MDTSPGSGTATVVRFDWPEYVAFGVTLAASLGIGIFHGCIQKKKTTAEFLLAGRSMGLLPISVSMIATYVSAIFMLGLPAEIYMHGTQYWLVSMTFVTCAIVSSYLYLPVFYGLQVTSVYEYLEMRFSYKVRLLGTCVCMISYTVYMAIAVYAPALALSQVSGIDINTGVAIIFVVCVFYTAIGGIKAVIWTDVLQAGVMYSAIAAIVIKGTIDLGGFNAVWEASKNGSRIEYFNFDLDPRVRHTFWGLVFGSYFTWMSYFGVSQPQVQRFLSVPTQEIARKAVLINSVGLNILFFVVCYCGLLVYTLYKDCDPIASKMVSSSEQLLPLFVMDTLGGIRGLPGLFVAGIFSGALSTISSVLNALSAIALEDIVRPRWKNMTEVSKTTTLKLLALGFGAAGYGLVFVARNLGGVQEANLALNGIIQGPLTGVFSLGMFFPWANAKGALAGTLSAMALMTWLGAASNIYKYNGWIRVSRLPVSVDQCLGNVSVPVHPPSFSGGVIEFYKLSYLWYALLGQCTVILVGLSVSLLTGSQDPRKLNPLLISGPVKTLLSSVLPQRFGKGKPEEIGSMYNSKVTSLNSKKLDQDSSEKPEARNTAV